MLNCVQNLQYYMMVEVIEPNWHNFLEKMSKVSDNKKNHLSVFITGGILPQGIPTSLQSNFAPVI